MTEVTLNLPEPLLAHAKKLGQATQRNVDVVLTDTLEMLWLTLEETPNLAELSISELPDDAVLKLSDAKMNESQNQRLGDLQANGKAAGLTDAERYELLALLQIYQLGQLRKSEALAEAFHRGLREPLSA
jgi:PHD/YefM family antitoxin component YafN of YafNO toxin-antitoxin module